MLHLNSIVLYQKAYTVETMPVDSTGMYFVSLEDIYAVKTPEGGINILLEHEAPVYDLHGKQMMSHQIMVGIVRSGNGFTQESYILLLDHLLMSNVGLEILDISEVLIDDEDIDDFIVFATDYNVKQNDTEEPVTIAPTYEDLKKELDQAVAEQDFEKATNLREKIALLSRKGKE